MEFKGTKGIWDITNNTPNGINELQGHIEIASAEWSIACVFTDFDEATANALLISKSPQMLEMLQKAFDEIELLQTLLRNNVGSSTGNLSAQIKELIKSATEF